jgi:2-polyprenyl-6-methoxyphenol hydroxylase-like FAD-dependent oxidoreductase
MQFHQNGFVTGDPRQFARTGAEHSSTALPAEVDVLIAGSGPTGLTLAAQLMQFDDISTLVVEQKPGRLTLGQADGIACRTVEMFEAFGFSDRVLSESYWVNETSFWKPGEAAGAGIVRGNRIDDTEEGLSEFPHVILNQARVHDFYLDVMRNAPAGREPAYGLKIVDVTVERDDPGALFPVTVRVERTEGADAGKIETIKAKYVVGCDGARSEIRKSLGRSLVGDSANQAWGVMDVLAVSDFPDVRLKSVIHSADEGSILIIPREGGYLTRFYVEMDELGESERAASRNLTIDQLIATAQRILHPYKLDVKEVAWWSIYEIGQRLCDTFDNRPLDNRDAALPRIFIAGDACHTHSPKAGQGMNVSMQDAFNLGWKLAAVLRGQSAPKLLRTYSDERRAIAKELIDFDREFAAMFSARPKQAGEEGDGIDPAEFTQYFVKQGRFTAGTATHYQASLICGEARSQHLAEGLVIGMRFHSAPVIRLADAKPMHLGHAFNADGRWRILAFASSEDTGANDGSAIRALCDFLTDSDRSPVKRYTPMGADIDAVIDVRAVFQQPHRDLDIATMPSLLMPSKGRYDLIDYEKMFCPDIRSGEDIFDMRSICRREGCIVIIRPDQYIANVLPLSDFDGISAFFDAFMVPAAVAA